VKRRIEPTVLKVTCAGADDVLINPLFAEFDRSTYTVRFVCTCGDLHEKYLPAEDVRAWTFDLRRAGCRVFDGPQGDLDLAWKD
jgi:hypothetical protein